MQKITEILTSYESTKGPIPFDNIILINFTATITVLDPSGESRIEVITEKLLVNNDIDPGLQVYYHLLSRPDGARISMHLSDIKVEGIEQWEAYWERWRNAETNERSDDTGSTQVDYTEPRESDGVLSLDDSRE